MLRPIACNDTSVERVAKARLRVHEPALRVGTKFRPRRVAATRAVADTAQAKQKVTSVHVASLSPQQRWSHRSGLPPGLPPERHKEKRVSSFLS